MISKKNNSSSLDWPLYHVGLSRLLVDFRDKMLDETRRDVDARYRKLVNDHKGQPIWDDFHKLIISRFGGSLTKIEYSRSAGEIIQLPSIEPLADAYGISAAMFDPLLAEPVDDYFLLHPSDKSPDLVRYDQNKHRRIYGPGVKYSIPTKKLSKTYNITLLYLEIEPDGSSVQHYHQGDELLYVEKGKIDLLFENTGIKAKVEAGEFIHFEGGQSHSASNPYDELAKVFLVRFLQLKSGTRTSLFNKLSVSKPSATTVARLVKDMRASAWTTNTRQEIDEPDEVFDRCGLGHFLQTLSSKSLASKRLGRLTLDSLVKRAKDLELDGYNRSKFARLHHGSIKVKKEELQKLEKIYSVNAFLFYDFLFPAFRYSIVAGESDMKKESREFKIPQGVVYKVPSRHLAYSDITIALVELDPKASTSENSHPGCELLKPLEGEVTVKFEGITGSSIKKGQYGYFYSNINHQVVNLGDKKVKMLVFRFLE